MLYLGQQFKFDTEVNKSNYKFDNAYDYKMYNSEPQTLDFQFYACYQIGCIERPFFSVFYMRGKGSGPENENADPMGP